MNIIEAVKLPKEGKKIRIKDWYFMDKEHCNYVYATKQMNGDYLGLCLHMEGTRHEDVAKFIESEVLSKDWEVLND